MTVMAIDTGGTRIKIGLVHEGRVMAETIIPAESDKGLAPALPRIEAALRQLCHSRAIVPGDCTGVAMGFPALVDFTRGRVLNHYGKFADAIHIDLEGWCRTAFGIPFALENDARLAMIGEWQNGAGKGCNNFAIITLGTGIGTAVLSEGRPLRGPHFLAGNLGGHLIVQLDGVPCTCGVNGCVEAETGSAYLPERARRHPGFGDSVLKETPIIDYKNVFEAAAAGDAVAAALRDRSLSLWGALCVNLARSFDLEVILLGGGIMGSADIILPALQAYCDRHARMLWGSITIKPTEYPDHMALLGAEWLINEKRNS
jgi:glucokinase